MIIPNFIFDAEANGYISEPFTVDERATVRLELSSRAPVVTLKQEEDGEFAICGQSPKSSDSYEIDITSTHEITVCLATPVEVTKCYVLN